MVMFHLFLYQAVYHLHIGGLLNFLKLLLYPGTLLKMFISRRDFQVEFLDSFMYTIISSSNSENWTSSFPICIPLISFCYLIDLARTLSTMLNRYGQSYLVSDFSGITEFLSI